MTVSETTPTTGRVSTRERLRRLLKILQREPAEEERLMEERRQRLLDDLSRAVAEAPDDVPIKSVIERLNRHRED